jgi:acyl transferase domain-containing protein
MVKLIVKTAGIPIEDVSGTQTSVHVGCLTFDYRHVRTRDLETTSDYDSIGISNSMTANRISWFFDCRGTSIMVDTACSSSLVALDMACQGLQRGEARMVRIQHTWRTPNIALKVTNSQLATRVLWQDQT